MSSNTSIVPHISPIRIVPIVAFLVRVSGSSDNPRRSNLIRFTGQKFESTATAEVIVLCR